MQSSMIIVFSAEFVNFFVEGPYSEKFTLGQ
jgi:hypothetical protein